MENSIPELFDIIETDPENKSTKVLAPNGATVTLPFQLEGISKTIELIKVPNRKKTEGFEYSLTSMPGTKYVINQTYFFTVTDVFVKSKDQKQLNIVELIDDEKNVFTSLISASVAQSIQKQSEVLCEVTKIYPTKIFLKHQTSHLDLKSGYTYELEYVESNQPLGLRKDLSTYILSLGERKYEIIGPSWVNHHVKVGDKIKCSVSKKKSANKIMMNFDDVLHPNFTIGLAYNFKFICEIPSYNSILVLGPDNKHYFVKRPFYLFNKEIEVDSMLTLVFLGLTQSGTIRTKYFVTFEDIISDFRALKRITFDAFRKDLEIVKDDSIIKKMFLDFDNFENIWIISFCEVLRLKIEESLYKKDYEEALIFIDVLLKIESWILDSGFLQSFSHYKRSTTTLVAVQEIQTLKRESKALELILDLEEQMHVEQVLSRIKNDDNFDQIETIYQALYIIKHQNSVGKFTIKQITEFVGELGKKSFFKNNKDAAAVAVQILEFQRIAFERDLFSNIHINSDKRKQFYIGKPELFDFIQISYCLLMLSSDLGTSVMTHQSLLRFLRLNSLYQSEEDKRLKIISTAIRVSSLVADKILEKVKGTYSWHLLFDASLLLSKAINIDSARRISNLKEIEHSYLDKTPIKVTIIGNSTIGYEATFKSDRLFIPFFNSKHNLHKGEDTNVVVYLIDTQFGHVLSRVFIDKSGIPINQEIIPGRLVTGIVKTIEDFGVFVDLGNHVGLIYRYDLSYHRVINCEDIVSIGETINVKILNVTTENDVQRISLSRREALVELNRDPIRIDEHYLAKIISVSNVYGLFVELENGITGLVKLDEVAWNTILDLSSTFETGSKITIKHLSNRKDRYYFSLKRTTISPFSFRFKPSKTFQGKILKIHDFFHWMENHAIEDKPHSVNNEMRTYCPHCYEKSAFRTTELDRCSEHRSIRLSTDGKTWICDNCGYSSGELLEVYIQEISSVSWCRMYELDEVSYKKVRRRLSYSNFIDVRIISIGSKDNSILVELNVDTMRSEKIAHKFDTHNKNIGFEIASCYEQFAFSLDDLSQRMTYLNWAKYYYGIAKSHKSYLLNIYVSYISIVTSIIEKSDHSEPFTKEIEDAKQLLSFIELHTTALESFSNIEKITVLLKIICCISNNSKESLEFLLDLALSDISEEHDYIKDLAAVILAISILLSSNPILEDSLKKQFYHSLQKSLSSLYEFELDQEDMDRKLIIQKCLSKGEDFSIEFKATLDVPVLSKDIKAKIAKLKLAMLQKGDEDERALCAREIESLSMVNKNDKQVIQEINLSFIKTIAAFGNSNGGYLIVGVDEDEEGKAYLMGIGEDLLRHKTKDAIKLKFDSLLQKYIGNGLSGQLIKSCNFVNYRGKELLLVVVNKLDQPVFVHVNNDKVYYIRRQASTVKLTDYELVEYIQSKLSLSNQVENLYHVLS